jgi:5-methyltetrahydrofolate--homocysteine methyltransferase
LREAGIRVPLLVGGAALSDKFTRLKIAPQYSNAVCYAKDAMTGLRLMNELSDPAHRDSVLQQHTHSATAVLDEPAPQAPAEPGQERSPRVRTDISIPQVAYLDRKVRAVPDLNEIWSYVNPFMVFGRHLGFRGNFEKALAERDPRALELFNNMEEVKREAAAILKISAVWQFFEAERRGNSIALFAPRGNSPVHTFHFQRQRAPGDLCLSDYILPAHDSRSLGGRSFSSDIKSPPSSGVLTPEEGDAPIRDHIALFVVTAGAGIREKAEEAKFAGRYFFSHALQALAIESAEACAEWLHRRIREDWGFPDPPGLTMADRFTSRYRGKRYSFGYPACPNLEDQAGIWLLLRPEEIGVHLTEGMMMDPEASVSALVFHHPDCNYFTVGDQPDQPADI